jgi:hypothetical protein
MLRPSVLKLVKFLLIATILIVGYFVENRETGRQIDLDSGRTRWFEKLPWIPEKYGPTEDNAFSNYVKTRLVTAKVDPRWRKTTSSGIGRFFSRTSMCYWHGGTESSLLVFMRLIERASIDDACRTKLVSEMFARLQSDDPNAVRNYYELCSTEFYTAELVDDAIQLPDCMDR